MVHELKRKVRGDDDANDGNDSDDRSTNGTSASAKRQAVHVSDCASPHNATDSKSSDGVAAKSVAVASSVAAPAALRFATESWQGLKPTNEDRHVTDDASTLFPGPVFGVFDGHGGVFTVEFLVRHLLKALHTSVKQHIPTKDMDTLVALQTESKSEAKRKQEIETQLSVCQEQLTQVLQLVDDSANAANGDATHVNGSSSSSANALREQLSSAVRALELAIAEIDREDAQRRERFHDWVLRHDALLKRAFVESFQRTDTQVIQKNPSRDGSTALLLCFIMGSSCSSPSDMAYFYTANLGDCRAVLCRNGHAIPLTTDHKPSRPDEKQRIVAAGGFVGTFHGIARVYSAAGAGLSVHQTPQSATYLAVSRAFGDVPLKTPTPLVSCEPEVKRFRVERDDLFIVVACDGIWDVLSNQDAVAIGLQHFTDAQRAADAIVKEAYRRGSSDNLTATVVQFTWHDHSPQLAHAQATCSGLAKSQSPTPRFVAPHSRVRSLAAADAASSDTMAGETTENQDDDDDDEEIDMFNL